MPAYYNEHDPFAAAWLRNLIAAGHIAPGDVDERSIVDVRPDDLVGYEQCHFFAGIGGWSLAFRLAGWPDDRPVWSASCPCQPLSSAGEQRGHADERHLWPALYELIPERGGPAIFGEQVASKLGREWLAGVRADLEGKGHAVGAADLCSASVGAPNIRQRLYWMAYANRQRREVQHLDLRQDPQRRREADLPESDGRSVADGLADAAGPGRAEQSERPGEQDRRAPQESGRLRDPRGLALAEHGGREGRDAERQGSGSALPSGAPDFWSRYDVVHCTDGKARRFEPGVQPLAAGVSSRVGRLRGYGNAINPQLAAEFIRAADYVLNGGIVR